MAGPRCLRCGSSEFVNKPGADAHGRCVECREFPTLGYLMMDLIHDVCVIPDREDAGLPLVATDEQYSIFLHHYRVNPFAEKVWNSRSERWIWRDMWIYPRGTQVEKPQKWGKAPLSSMWICGECHPESPAVFDGWGADGRPQGRPWPQPHFQVTACSEDQADNIWRVLLPMIQLGPLADVFPDSGLTRINTPSGGLIEPVTAAATSRLGARIHGSAQDQTESWFASNGGHKVADAQRRGLAGTGGRFFATPNAYAPEEDSTAQRTASEPGVFCTYVEPMAGSVRSRKERDPVLDQQYGDSLIERGGWIDKNRIHVEIEAMLEHDPAQGERWFLNRRLSAEGAAFDIEAWLEKYRAGYVPSLDTVKVAGIDGALNDDALAVVACEVETGFMWPVAIWERPDDAGPDYEHPLHEVDQAVDEFLTDHNVWRIYVDPQHIRHLMVGWQNRHGDRKIVDWPTYRPREIAWAVRNFERAIARTARGKDDDGLMRPPLSHGVPAVKDPEPALTRHVRNARKRLLTVKDDKEKLMHTLSKPAQKSPLKVDGAMGGVLAWQASADCIRDGAVWLGDDPAGPVVPKEPEVFVPGRAPNMADLVSAGAQAPGDFS